jgi:hypothetical protein
MALLVARMTQVQPAQPRVGRQLGGPGKVAPAVGLDLGETQKAKAPA